MYFKEIYVTMYPFETNAIYSKYTSMDWFSVQNKILEIEQ